MPRWAFLDVLKGGDRGLVVYVCVILDIKNKILLHGMLACLLFDTSKIPEKTGG